MSIANINSYIVRSATQLNLGIEPTEATNEAIRLGSIDQVSSAGVFPSLVFHVTIQNTLCELSIRAIQINAFNYLIKSSLRGIEAKGKAEVKSLQLNMKEFQNKQKSLLGRYEIRKESVLLRIKNALLLPLFHRDSLHLMNLPSQILLQVLTYSQADELCGLSCVNRAFREAVGFPMLWRGLLLKDFGINTDGANTLSTDSPAVDNPRDTYKEHFLRRKSSTQYRRLQHRTFVEMDPNYFGELSPIGGAYYQPAPEWSLPPLHPFNTPAHREGDQQGGLWQPPSVLDHGSSRLQPAFENPFRY